MKENITPDGFGLKKYEQPIPSGSQVTFTSLVTNSHLGFSGRRVWTNAEIRAVMRFFKSHITNGKLASQGECKLCKNTEHPVLQNRTIQNIRDFVRNKGIRHKRQMSVPN